MNCKHCDHPIPPHARFCIKCGQAINENLSASTPPPSDSLPTQLPKVPPAILPPAADNSANGKKGCGCITLFLVCTLAVGIISNVNKHNNQSENEQQPNSGQQTEVPQTRTDSLHKKNSEKTTITIKESPKQPQTKSPAKPHKAIILDGAISPIPTQKGKGFDKTIARYGVQRIKKINKLLPLVAEKAATAKYMDIIWNVDVSDNYSTASELIFYADAKNGNRVYISEDLVILDAKKMY